MAKKIQIDIEVNGKMQKVTVDAKKLRHELDGIDKSQQKVDKSTRNSSRNMQGLSKRTSNTTKEFSKMQQGMGGIVGIYATIAAQVFAVSAAFQFLKSASDISNLIAGQQALGAVTGVAYGTLVDSIRDATNGQLAFAEASRAAAIGTAGGLSASQLDGLAKAAKNASVTLGRDLTDSFNRLIRGTTKAEPELLDELGIILRLDTALEKYSIAIGKNVDELNAFERTQAVANEVLEQAEQKFGAIEDILDPSTASLNRFLNSFDDLINTLKVGIIGGLRPVFDFLSDNTAGLVGALTLFSLPILKAILPNFKAWEQASKKTLSVQEKKLDKLNKKINKYNVDLGKVNKSEKELLRATADRVDAAIKESGSEKLGSRGKTSGLGFLTGQDSEEFNRQAQQRARTSLDKAREELKENAGKRTTILRKMNVDQLDDLERSYEQRSKVLDGQNIAFRDQAEQQRLEQKKAEKTSKAHAARMNVTMAKAAKGMARAFNMAILATGIIGFVSLLISVGQELYQLMFPANKEIQEIEDNVDSMTEKLNGLSEELGRMGTAFKMPNVSLADKVQLLGNMAGSADLMNLIQQLDQLKASTDGTSVSTKSTSIAFNDVISKIRAIDPQLADLAVEFKNADKSEEGAAGSLEGYVKQLREGAKAAKDLPGELAKINKELQSMRDSVKEVTPLDKLFELNKAAAKSSLDSLQSSQNAVKILEGNLTKAQAVADKLENTTQRTATTPQGRRRRPGSQGYRGGNDRALRGATAAAKLAEDSLEAAREQLSAQELENKKIQDNKKLIGDARTESVEGLKKANAEIAKGVAMRTAGLTQAGKQANIEARVTELAGKALLAEAKRDTVKKSIDAMTAKQIEENPLLADALTAMLQIEEDKLSAAEKALQIEKEKADIALKLLPLQEQAAALSAEGKIISAQNKLTDGLEKEVQLRMQAIDLQASMASERIQLEAAEAKTKNPFFDDEKFIADRELEVAKQIRAEKAPLIEREFKLKTGAIKLEYDLLDIKKEQLAIELEILAISQERDNPELAKRARDMAAEVSAIDYSGARQAANHFAEIEKRSKLIKLENAERSAQNVVDNLDPVNQILATAAQGFKDGLTDAITGIFDSLIDGTKSVKDALLDAGRAFVKLLQEEITRILIVDPIIQLMFPSTSTAAQIIAGHTSGAAVVGTAITTAHTTAFTVGGPAHSGLVTAFTSGAAVVGTAITTALSTPVDLGCCGTGGGELEPNRPGPADPNIRSTVAGDIKSPTELKTDGLNSAGTSPMTPGYGTEFYTDKTGMEVVATKAKSLKGFKGATSNFIGSLGDIFDKNAEGGFMEKLGKAFEAGGGLFKGLFDSLPQSFQGIFNDLFSFLGPSGGSAGFGGTIGATLGGAIGGPLGAAVGGAFGGMLGFADGGYTSKVSAYSAGGVARGPRTGYPAMLHGNEAVVPLPDGKSIPVTMPGGGTQNNVTVNVSIDSKGNSTQDISSQSKDAEYLGKAISIAVQQELQNQKRSGGILSPHGVA